MSAALEAILFTSSRPLKLRELQDATQADRPTVEAALDELRDALCQRGLMLQRQQDLVHLVTRPELAGYVRRALRPEVTGRLSAAAYETLAIVAYQQPVTRSRIEEIRGVNCDRVLANLELRDLVAEVGRLPGPGQAKLYGTTMRFLQMLGLESLDQLPEPADGNNKEEKKPDLGLRPGSAGPNAMPIPNATQTGGAEEGGAGGRPASPQSGLESLDQLPEPEGESGSRAEHPPASPQSGGESSSPSD